MLLCAVLVLATFSASGHLRVGASNRAVPPAVAQRLDGPRREPPPLRVNGSVLDTMGFLLAGAEVSINGLRTHTDADGRFQVDVARAPSADLLLAAVGHVPSWLRAWPGAAEPVFAALEPSAPWDSSAQVAPANPLPAVAGLIGEGFVRTDRGAPLAGALVFVAGTLAMARTDETGRYEVPLPPEPTAVLVHQPEGGPDERGFAGRAAVAQSPRRSGRVPLPDLGASPASVLRGAVRDGAGQPQKGVPMQIVGAGFARTIATGEGGTFRLAGLLPGAYELRVGAFRGAMGTTRRLDLTGAVTDCDLQLRAIPERRMQIVSETGVPIARAVVAASLDGLRREVARSDDAGYVQLRAAEPDTRFDVRRDADWLPLRVVAPPEADGRIVVALP